jgi:hypothetical protein
MMVQAANMWSSDDLSLPRRLNHPGNRSVSLQRQMCSGAVVVLEVLDQDSA